MALPASTPVDRGPGSVTPTFTPPQVPVITPGLNMEAPPTPLTILREAFNLVGQGAVDVARATASINSRLASLKEQSVARVEADLNRAARGLQQRRLGRAFKQRQNILSSAGEKGWEWAEQALRTSMLNASSQEEAKLWEAGWSAASQNVAYRMEEADKQAFNSAARSIELASLQMRQQLMEDPNLKAELIGNGVGIAQRVQDWMLTEASAAAPNAFIIEPGDPSGSAKSQNRDLLVHSLMKQAFGVAGDLTQEYQNSVEKSKAILGGNQIEADIFSTFSGEQDPKSLQVQLESTLHNNFGPLPPEQQNELVRRSIMQQAKDMADGKYGLDAVSGFQSMQSVMDMALNGSPLFNDEQRAAMSADLMARAQRTASASLIGRLSKFENGMLEQIQTSDGVVFRNNPNAPAMLSAPGQDGLSEVDRQVHGLLNEMGLIGKELTTDEALLMSSVVAAGEEYSSRSEQTMTRRLSNAQNFNQVMQGLPGGRADDAYTLSPEFSAFTGMGEHTASDMLQFKDQLSEIAKASGIPTDVIQRWNGERVEYTDEQRPLVQAIQLHEAARWNEDPVQDTYGMPNKLVENKISLLRSQDTNKREAFMHFVSNLKSGNNSALDNFLNHSALTEQDRAAVTWLRTSARLGQATEVGLSEAQPDIANLSTQIDSILSAPTVGDWMKQEIGSDTNTTNESRMSQVMLSIMADQSDFDFEEDPDFQSQLTAQLRTAFAGNNPAFQFIRRMWFAGRQANPELPDEAIGAQIWSYLRADGYRFRSVGGNMRMVVDPQGYTGPEGGDIQQWVDKHKTLEFQPVVRAFYQEALGLSPLDAPVNMQDLFIKANPNYFIGADPRDPSAMRIGWTLNEQITDRMLESRANLGGFPVFGYTPNGEPIPMPVAQRDMTFMWPDGHAVFIPRGTVLPILNPDLFSTPRTRAIEAPDTAVRRVSPQLRE